MAPQAARIRRRRRVRRAVKWCAIAAVALPVLAFALFELAVRLLPYPAGIDRPPPAATLVVDRDGRPLAAFAAADGRWHLPLPEDQVSPRLLAAVVAVEDARFLDHAGIDWVGAAGAARDNLLAGGVRRGASTLSMQLHRLRAPRPRGFLAKLDQALRARQIERSATKRQVLLEYVNRAPFGGALVGAGAASWRYFGKPCADLSLGEAALLAGLPQNPNVLRPDRHPEAALRRRSHVLRRMRALDVITAAEFAEADAEPLTAAWRDLPQDRATDGPAADGALAALLGLAGDAKARGGTIVSTIDARTQALAAQLAAERLRALAASGVSAAAVLALETDTGRCLASVSLETTGGRIVASPLDLTRRPRSTGSVLKPFIYAAAFDAGIASPQTRLRDEPSAWPAYLPGNYDRAFAGELSAADALARSRNIPALVLLEKVGVSRALGVLESAGVATPARAAKPVGLSLAVGGADATPVEVAQAFATLARGGVARPAALVRSPDDAREAVGCVRPAACAQTMRALADRDRTLGVCPEAARADVAWKTGTSSGHRDAWCAAATPNVTVVVWLGNTTGRASTALVGQEAAAPLALRLAAAIDPSPRPWPGVEATATVEVAPVRRGTATPAATAGPLLVVWPHAGATVVLDPDLSPDRQRVALQSARQHAAGNAPAPCGQRIWWFVNGTLVGVAPAGERVWWTPTPGQHEVRATDAAGRSATSRFKVARPELGGDG